jgi:3-hydroxyisobutyrate dehydrogenase-like beta-hydroxyacid dehydrogenase
MKIAFLGLGKMGSPLAGHLLNSGHQITVWNRSSEKTRVLASVGAIVAETPGEAVADAEIVFTMFNDDTAVETIAFGGAELPGIVTAVRPGAIHVSLSTISVRLSQRLADEHRKSGSHFLAAPVFGRPNVAADGKLWIVIGGAPELVAKVSPLLETFSRGITIVSDEPSRAHALKIGGNFLITAMIESLSEAGVFAESQGIDPALFFEAINNALFRSPLYEAYSKVMLKPPEKPGATIALGAKDMGLFRQAAQDANMTAPLANHFAADLERAAETGLSDRDWAAGLYQLTRSTSLPAQ